jgi:hypothetical protein
MLNPQAEHQKGLACSAFEEALAGGWYGFRAITLAGVPVF